MMRAHLSEMWTDMPAIRTLDEAIDACDTLRHFLDGIETTFRSSRVAPRPEAAETAGKAATHGNSKTATWPERIGAILREANEPLAATDIIRIYKDRHDSGDSSPEEVGKRVRSVLWKMKERNQLSHDRTSGKYRLKEKPP